RATPRAARSSGPTSAYHRAGRTAAPPLGLRRRVLPASPCDSTWRLSRRFCRACTRVAGGSRPRHRARAAPSRRACGHRRAHLCGAPSVARPWRRDPARASTPRGSRSAIRGPVAQQACCHTPARCRSASPCPCRRRLAPARGPRTARPWWAPRSPGPSRPWRSAAHSRTTPGLPASHPARRGTTPATPAPPRRRACCQFPDRCRYLNLTRASIRSNRSATGRFLFLARYPEADGLHAGFGARADAPLAENGRLGSFLRCGESTVDCPDGSLSSGVQPEFAQDVLDMDTHRGRTDHHLRPNSLVCQAARQHRRHLPFASREIGGGLDLVVRRLYRACKRDRFVDPQMLSVLPLILKCVLSQPAARDRQPPIQALAIAWEWHCSDRIAQAVDRARDPHR